MLHIWSFLARWFRFLAGRPGPRSSASSASSRFSAPSASAGASRPRRPAPMPGSEDFWLALASSYLPESAWSTLEDGLRLAVRTRAYWGQVGKLWPDERPAEPPEWRRFGTFGEELAPKTRQAVEQGIVKELKRTIHTLEAPGLSRLERNWKLLLHGARLGQLYIELARRSGPQELLEAVRRALAALLE